jgi:hypothetical protein
MACTLIQSELIKAEESGKKPTDIAKLYELAEWFCSFAAANERMSVRAREQVAGLWFRMQATTADLHDGFEAITSAAMNALTPLNLPQGHLETLVLAEMVLRVARLHEAGTAPPDAVETARIWCEKLSRDPQMAVVLSKATQDLGVDPPKPTPVPVSNDPPMQDRIIAPAGDPVPAALGRRGKDDEQLGDQDHQPRTNEEICGPDLVQGTTTIIPDKGGRSAGTAPVYERGRQSFKPNPARESMRQWKQPFRSEEDVAAGFHRCAGWLLELLNELGLDMPKEAKGLQFSLDQYDRWVKDPTGNSNMFLAPGVQAAAEIAKELVRVGRNDKAFPISNDFFEMAKILLARARDKYLNPYQDLLWVACCAASDAWQPGESKVSHTNGTS